VVPGRHLSSGECLLVIREEYLTGASALNVADVVSSIQPKFHVIADSVRKFVRDEHLFVTYRTRSGLCLRSFNNRFIFNEFERQLVAKWPEIPLTQNASVLRENDRYFVKIGNLKNIGVVINFNRSAKSITATLNSHQLRGVTYTSGSQYLRSVIEQPSLVFVNTVSGQTDTHHFFRGSIGDEGKGVITPITIPKIFLAAGNYRVHFKTILNDVEPWKVDIQLTDSFEVSNR